MKCRFVGSTLDFNLTAGVVIWPVVFITSDIINEYFGKAGVRKMIAKINEELAVFESREEARLATPR